MDNIHGMGGLGVINDIYGLFVKLGSSTGQYIDCSEIDKIKDIILSNNERGKWQDPAEFLEKLFSNISLSSNNVIKNLLIVNGPILYRNPHFIEEMERCVEELERCYDSYTLKNMG